MSLLRHVQASLVAVACLAVSLLSSGAVAQAEDGAKQEFGEVTGNDVYVRSGASLNHYPVCKLDAGSRVTIVGTNGEWLEIKPPDESFSWISAEFVDTVDDREGVVNGDNVRVRAGSVLPKWSKSKYAVQTMLNKGSEVAILGKNPDGYLQIAPPPDATLWVHQEFIERVSGNAVAGAAPKSAPGASVVGSSDSSAPIENGGTPERKTVIKGGASSPFASMPMTAERKLLEDLDREAKLETDKPMLERQFAPLIARYQKIVEQEEDEFASRYAQTRVTQLSHMSEMIEAVLRTRGLRTDTDDHRRVLLEERLKMQIVTVPTPRGLDVRGLLRTSALYPEGTDVRRFRLVDPATPEGRTIAYIEIPVDSKVNPTSFLGQYVGVRAVQRRFQEGGVDTIPIYVVDEIVLLDSPQEAAVSDANQ